MRPATPGFLVTLTATILLAVVSFSVPWFKSIFFLKASLAVEGVSGSITFGVLGYCLELNNGTTCSKPSIGYDLDINQLVGDNTRIQIPQVIVKWLTYALVLHIVALVLATISSVFGLLAHVREFSMTCFSTCISGLGATVTLLAFIFDLAFFFLAKSRINSVNGGSATMGIAIWLTLAAWILLFFSGCFYGLGRCCIRRRPRDMTPSDGGRWVPAPSTGPTYEEQMRLDAVKAEADRKARQTKSEVGLPAFAEYDPTQPLTSDAEHEAQPPFSYRDAQYAAAPVGTRAVDEYYAAGNNNAYPPRRQPTTSSAYTQQTGYAHSQQTSGYAPSTYAAATAVSTGAPVSSGYLNANNIRYQDEQYPSQASSGYGQSTYSACISGDPFRAYTPSQTQASLNPSTYNTTARFSPPPVPSSTHPQPYSSPVPEPPSSYYTPQVQTAAAPPSRSYTLGGGGYGNSTVPALHNPHTSTNSDGLLPYPGEVLSQSSGSVYTGVDSPGTSMRGRELIDRLPSPVYDDSPPMYDDGDGLGPTSHTPVASGKR
ncbi:SUR7/PalI family-domain-containing protein [Russula compacta]|nr:SUR7/PalI family-domain-containing protein [Russula compacta]